MEQQGLTQRPALNIKTAGGGGRHRLTCTHGKRVDGDVESREASSGGTDRDVVGDEAANRHCEPVWMLGLFGLSGFVGLVLVIRTV
jgi:hypothetical protein